MINHRLKEYPKKNHKQIYNQIMHNKNDAKYKRVMKIVENRVFDRYDEYIESKSELSVISEDTFFKRTLVRKVLHSCYGSNTTLGEVKADIKETQRLEFRGTCPYCLIGEDSSFDHYLPKGKFPEFSVLPYNLIPSCSKCNTYKSECWLDGSNRKIINLFYDIIPTQKFLLCEIISNGYYNVPKIVYKLDNQSFHNTIEYNKVLTHFNRLRLLSRYQERALGELICIMKSLSRMELEDAKTILSFSRKKENNKFGVNYWMTSMYEAILNNQIFLKEVLQGNYDKLLNQRK